MSERIESVLQEGRRFSPPESFRAKARLSDRAEYDRLYRQSLDDPDRFWSDVAGELHWFTPWRRVREWNEPFVKWFVGGETNLAYNCLDRHLEAGKGDKPAIVWEGEPGDERVLTYKDLHREVARFANVLKARGLGKGDRVAIYLPMIPEAAVAMLACARIGATHSVVFGGFSASALADRINDARAKAVITADGGYRRGAVFPLKPAVDEALEHCPSIDTVVVVTRGGNDVAMKPGRDLWYHEAVAAASADCPAEPLGAEHPLFILHTSGSTGKPKGVLHSTAGYSVYTYLTSRYIFDMQDEDVFWCTADVGWITGHSYIVYGPLQNGATVLMYEGVPNHPGPDRFWRLIDKYKVTIFYTAPTAIRAFMKWGEKWPRGHDLTSLRLLGTVGEPINPEAWMWYHRHIGGEGCPIVDTWWQTETGGIMITTLPGVHDAKPGSAGLPFFGVEPAVVDVDGNVQAEGDGGYLVIKRPWPSMLRTVYGDDDRYRAQYWSEIPHVYFAGDGARKDSDGYYWIMGRVDDVVNVSGHRLGTMEVESALVSHEAVAEAAVVGRPDETKGQSIVAFVTLEGDREGSDELRRALRDHVTKEIGAIARPDEIRFADALPKTRSGKIMRRLLRSVALGEEAGGDISTLEDKSVVEKLMRPD
ncbi:MAG: acetate--CoA ligase [Deinococcota bacterium]|jgi:acetyl-CoA synthetase|nr:acetate--CoA ligase [Deinococcota bacterium]